VAEVLVFSADVFVKPTVIPMQEHGCIEYQKQTQDSDLRQMSYRKTLESSLHHGKIGVLVNKAQKNQP